MCVYIYIYEGSVLARSPRFVFCLSLRAMQVSFSSLAEDKGLGLGLGLGLGFSVVALGSRLYSHADNAFCLPRSSL